MTIEDGFLITIQDKPVPVETVRKSPDSEYVLEVDVETAWKKMGLEPGWSNEVPVKVYFGT